MTKQKKKPVRRTNGNHREPPTPVGKMSSQGVVESTPLTDEQEVQVATLEAVVGKHLEEAVRSGHLMVCVWHLNGADVKFWRKTGDFLSEDFEVALDLLETSLRTEKERIDSKGKE